MEMPPFNKGGRDIIWGLPFFGLVVLGLAVSGLIAAVSVRHRAIRGEKLVTADF
jgi:hypothetical protein